MTTSARQGRDTASLRRHNLQAVLHHLHLHGPTSRVRLGEVTGLTRTAIADLVTELTGHELVTESGRNQPHAGRGRPPMIVSPSDRRAYVLAVSVEVDTITVGRVGLGGRLSEELSVPHHYRRGNPGQSLDQLTELLAARIDSASPPLGIGMAVPGLVRDVDGLVARAPNLGWRNVSLGDELRARLPVPCPVIVANEARLAALAEHRRGAGTGCRHLVYVSAEVGVGAGVIIDDRVLDGSVGYAGEAGHMIVRPGGLRCHCGGSGCWETEVGADALLRHAGTRHPRNRRAAVTRLTSRAREGDAAAVDAFAALCPAVAAGVTNLINLFDPERIVLGGLLVPLLECVPGQLRAAMAENRGLPEIDVELVPAELGDQVRLLGAAEAAVNRALAELP